MPDESPQSPSAADVGSILDNVSVSTSLLPSTCLVLIGFVGLGFVSSRGSKKNTAARAAA
jgi:hypothetical protein